MQIAPFLFFNGNCREAMNFYAQCFGGLLEFVTYGEAPADGLIHPTSASGKKDDIIYSALRNENNMLPFITAADISSNHTMPINNGSITLYCSNNDQLENVFQQLSQEGKVVQSLTNVFWSARIGKVMDKYDVSWFLNYEID